MRKKPYIVVVKVYHYSGTNEHSFYSVKEAQQFRETIDNWAIKTSITMDYDR